MLVVDTNIIAYLYLPTDYSSLAETLLLQEPHWAAPLLWRSELRNVLALYLRQGKIALDTALRIQDQAEQLMGGNEFEVASSAVLSLSMTSRCSAYDCEFVALARAMNTTLVTADKKLSKAFPDTCTLLESFVAQ